MPVIVFQLLQNNKDNYSLLELFVFLSVDVSMDFFVEDDDASSGSDDSDAILPDLRSCTQDLNEPDLRASRAHSALRRTNPVSTADKIPFGIKCVDLSFQYDNKARSSHKNTGERPVPFISFNNFILFH